MAMSSTVCNSALSSKVRIRGLSLWARNSCSRKTAILISFITGGAQIRKIFDQIDVDSESPQVSPARGPPLWDDCSDAQTDEAVHIEPIGIWRRNRHGTFRLISA